MGGVCKSIIKALKGTLTYMLSKVLLRRCHVYAKSALKPLFVKDMQDRIRKGVQIAKDVLKETEANCSCKKSYMKKRTYRLRKTTAKG